MKQRRQRQDLRTNAGLFENRKRRIWPKMLENVWEEHWCANKRLPYGLWGFIDKCRETNFISPEISSQWRKWRIKQEFHLSSELKLLAAKGYTLGQFCSNIKHNMTEHGVYQKRTIPNRPKENRNPYS